MPVLHSLTITLDITKQHLGTFTLILSCITFKFLNDLAIFVISFMLTCNMIKLSFKNAVLLKSQISSMVAVAYLEPRQTSTTEHFWENSQRLKAVNYFHGKTLSQMFHFVLNTPLGGSCMIFFLQRGIWGPVKYDYEGDFSPKQLTAENRLYFFWKELDHICLIRSKYTSEQDF